MDLFRQLDVGHQVDVHVVQGPCLEVPGRLKLLIPRLDLPRHSTVLLEDVARRMEVEAPFSTVHDDRIVVRHQIADPLQTDHQGRIE